MTNVLLPPGLILVFGALAIAFSGNSRIRQALVLGLPLLTLISIWLTPLGDNILLPFLEYQLQPLSFSATSRVFATIFALMTLIGGLYALHQASTLELSAAFAYAGSAICVTSAGDLITLFIFWELMAIGSTLVVWAGNTELAYKASFRYLLIHLLGGVILMSGIVGHIYQSGSIEFTLFKLDSTASWLILAGFLVNAGAPPFSSWIADAYPEASPSGSVFLSAFTTKTAVYALMIGFAGSDVLIYIGLYMVFYGIIYALLENDMRRILAYSIVNQVGFMVTAIGIGSQMALNGATAHAFAHIIYKALLLMSAGSVLLQTGERRCSHLGGLFQTMPVTAFHGIIGALAISAFPFTSGFVTKSLETSAAAYEGLAFVWFLLMAASAGVFLHAGIKFPWFVFFQKDSGKRPEEAPLNMRLAMWVFSFLCIAIGLFPQPLYNILPYAVKYEPYTVDHLVTQFQLLVFAGAAFFVFLPMMKRTLTISLDFDWLYRRLIYRLGLKLFDGIWRVDAVIRQAGLACFNGLCTFIVEHAPSGILSKTRPSSSMVIWVTAMLAILVVSFIL
ncbi:Na(+)/H(+) antiporter subunit D [Agarilytica rhodophyticola]|uniref:Na(+)/H(+) antiporter subunit D n=1 Tax=Agarilytica rhodophyticola TaxID=1737490 RepID=UPI000B34868E|nr:Na(+)/H(+) antiporter subunit D [Agarilytica rhodophyticola]